MYCRSSISFLSHQTIEVPVSFLYAIIWKIVQASSDISHDEESAVYTQHSSECILY